MSILEGKLKLSQNVEKWKVIESWYMIQYLGITNQ